jgi:hypothetical protein
MDSQLHAGGAGFQFVGYIAHHREGTRDVNVLVGLIYIDQ